MMTRTLCILSLMLCWAASAVAVPAMPGWHTITQSDGSSLKVQTVGDAFNNAILTTDGLTVERGSDGDFYYVSSLTGLTKVRAHEPERRNASEKAFVAAQRGSLSMQFKPYKLPASKGMLTATGSNSQAAVPAQGARSIPIILVEFQDKKFVNSREKIIESMLTGEVSVGQYFRDQSNGLYQPEFDVHGIYTLSENREYYGGRDGNAKDKGIGWMVTEACELAAADGVSFRPYDTNDDNYCDVVIIIFAGVGEAQASLNCPDAIWPCNWTLEAAQYYKRGGHGPFSPNQGDPYVNHFAVFNEVHGTSDRAKAIDGIGTFVHEFGHCLGLPDMYDTGNSDYYGMGNWDIMCLGCYADDGYMPVGYSAYEKVFMKWVEFITPEPNTYYTLPVWNQKNEETDKAVCIVSGLNRNEYFIFENRRRIGWDRYLPGQGVMVTHITYSSSYWTNNKPNNDKIQLITLLPADNKLTKYTESTDLWPQNRNTAVTDDSTPATILYMTSGGSIVGDAGYLGKPVTDIVINSDGTASFWYMKKPVTHPEITVSLTEVDFGNVKNSSSETRTFKVIGQELSGDVTLTLNAPAGGFSVSPTVISDAAAASGAVVTVTFRPTAVQDYTATLTASSPEAQDVVINLMGHGCELGDVNHDGVVSVGDVTVLISAVLNNSNDICPVCADINGDSNITIGDVTALISLVLSHA